MDLFQLETFLAVAEERSFSRAATRLHRTQPAVSQAIAKLESELGEVLLERSSRDGTLTDAGEVLREYAVKLLNLRTEAAGALSELRELHRGRLNLAANEYTCLYLLPVLDEFRRRNPRIKIAVQRALASRIPDEVLMHSVEIGVMSFKPDDPQVRSVVVYRDELDFVVNPKHPLAREEEVSIRQLGAQNFIAHNIPSPQRQKVIDTFKRHKTPLRMGVELPSLEAIKRFVEMGNGGGAGAGADGEDGAGQRSVGAGTGAGAAVGTAVATGVPAAGEPEPCGGGVSKGGGGVCGGAWRSVLFSGRAVRRRLAAEAFIGCGWAGTEISFGVLKQNWRMARL
jgi:DNA-binding transcriptional LysR family regulator